MAEQTKKKTRIPLKVRSTTLVDVATAAKVTPAVVSSLLRATGGRGRGGNGVGCSPATAERILRACRRLRYDPPDPSARIRLYPQEGGYAFLLSDSAGTNFTNPYFARIIHGVVKALGPLSGHFSFSHFSRDIDYLMLREKLPPSARDATITRFVLAGEPNYSLLQALRQRGAALVYVSRFIAVDGMISVLADHAAAARLGIEHLSGLGHRRITVLAPDYLQTDSHPAREFVQGLLAGMRQARLPFTASDVIYIPQTEAGVRQTFEAMRASNHIPSALFCLTDDIASLVLRTAPSYGLHIPKDLSVAGCQGTAGSGSHPSLTTVHFPCEDMGRQAVHELQKAFDRPALTRPRRVVLPVTLVKGETTAPFAAGVLQVP